MPAALLKKRLWHKCFPVNFEKIFSYRAPPVAASELHTKGRFLGKIPPVYPFRLISMLHEFHGE